MSKNNMFVVLEDNSLILQKFGDIFIFKMILTFSFLLTFFFYIATKKSKNDFEIKKFFYLMYFSFSFVAKKRERKVPKERENTLPLPTLLRAFYKMDD